MSVTLHIGDCRAVLRTLPAESVHAVVTSPPYFGLRDYRVPPLVWGGDPGCDHQWDAPLRRHKGGASGNGAIHDRAVTAQNAVRDITAGAFCARCRAWLGHLGLEPTPDLWVEHLVEVFREVRRVLRPEGVVWLNLGDCYATGAGYVGECPGGGDEGERWKKKGVMTPANRLPLPGYKPKDLIGAPWMAAFALRADGWWLRRDLVWDKPNAKPESVGDRPSTAHEYVFLLSKSERYFYDAAGYRERTVSLDPEHPSYRPNSAELAAANRRKVAHAKHETSARSYDVAGRNARSVWRLTCERYLDAHFAVMPRKLVTRCILLGTSAHGACGACGAPWQRETRKRRDFLSGSGKSGRDPIGKAGGRVEGGGETRDMRRGPVVSVETLGWLSTCGCVDRSGPRARRAGVVPSVVLDPFGGSGTVGEVAERLGRDAVLIELNPDYAEQVARRTAQCGLLASRSA